jgi:homogentisate 1,2-dioxygenase
VKDHGEDLARMKKNRILLDGEGVDKDHHEDKLLQIFTANVIGPIFFEIIQRKGNQGFGEWQLPRAVRVHRGRPDRPRSHLSDERPLHRQRLRYMSGFGSYHESEAVAGALPQGQNSPQKVAFGLYAEATLGIGVHRAALGKPALVAVPLRPSAMHGPFEQLDEGLVRTAVCREAEVTPNRLRWKPLAMSAGKADFVDGLITYATCGTRARSTARRSTSMRSTARWPSAPSTTPTASCWSVPWEGELLFVTEFGRLSVAPGEVAVIPRGVKFRVEIAGKGRARIRVRELRRALPPAGAGADRLQRPRERARLPRAVRRLRDRDERTEVVAKLGGHLWSVEYDHSPLDVVAWHGNFYPYKYDPRALQRDQHRELRPSGSVDLHRAHVAVGHARHRERRLRDLPPALDGGREKTFRPPWFHRNVMSEFLGLVKGEYDAKKEGFAPGAASLHNAMSAHGPDRASYEKAVGAT